MAYNRKVAAFVGYLDIPLSGDDLTVIIDTQSEIDTNFMEIMEYAVPKKLDVKFRYDMENEVWKCSLYQNDPKHEWAGIGVSGSGNRPELATAALAQKLRIIGKRDWLTLVRKSNTNELGIS